MRFESVTPAGLVAAIAARYSIAAMSSLRQGLLGYARQVTRGFIHAAAGPLRLTEAQQRELFEELAEPLAAEVGAQVATTPGPDRSGPLG